MVAIIGFVALLACQVCAVESYKLANTRMQIRMASSNPFNTFLGGLNKPSPSDAGVRRPCYTDFIASCILRIMNGNHFDERIEIVETHHSEGNQTFHIIPHFPPISLIHVIANIKKHIICQSVELFSTCESLNQQYQTMTNTISFFSCWEDCADYGCNGINWYRTHEVFKKQKCHSKTAYHWF